MDSARATIAEMKADEARLLRERKERTDSASASTAIVIILGVIVGMVALVMAASAIQRQVSLNLEAKARADALNADLERRVHDRTALLAESEGRLAGVIQSAMDAIITLDDQHRVLLMNAAAETMFRTRAPEVIGQTIDRFIPGRFRSAHPQHIHNFSHTGVTSRSMGRMSELAALRADGEEFPIEASISQIASGGKKLFTVILRDITERKQAEEALRESHARLKKVLEVETVGVMFWDLTDGTLVDSNSTFLHLMGYTRKDLEARSLTWQKLTPPEYIELSRSELKKFQAGGRIGPYEKECLHKDGTRQWFVFAGSSLGANSCVEFCVDISARKKAEADLERLVATVAEQARTLQSVLDNINDGLIAADSRGRFILWNPAADRILGKSRKDVPPAEWSQYYEIYQADRKTPFLAEELPLAKAMRGQRAFAEMFIRHADSGYGSWVEAAASPLRDQDGAVSGGVVAFRDVTQRVIADREIRKLNAELEQRVIERTAQLEMANKELEAFTYSVSHDLRAPLRHIKGFTRILCQEFSASVPPEAQQYLQRVDQAALQMSQLVDELLELSRVGRGSLAMQATGLGSLVKDVLAILEPESHNRQVQWKIGELPTAECDPALLRQVFQNLIGNALKYSRTRVPAIIEIGQRENNGENVIFVRDNGVGFSMKYADKLFGVFQRLHRADEFEGTGIGLATVQRIIHKHGGRVWAEAEVDRGATFYFTLASLGGVQKQSSAASAGSAP